jgi:hypothetical protein
MSYDVPTKDFAISVDVEALATLLAQRQSDSGTTNGGIVASGGSSPVPQLGVDASGLGLAYLKAMADAFLCAVGPQGSGPLINTAGSGTTLSASPATVASASFTAPMARTYEFACDVAGLANNVSGSTISFSILIDGGSSFSVLAGKMISNDSVRHNCSWRQRISLSAGAHTIAIQAAANAGNGPFDTSTFITVHVR